MGYEMVRKMVRKKVRKMVRKMARSPCLLLTLYRAAVDAAPRLLEGAPFEILVAHLG